MVNVELLRFTEVPYVFSMSGALLLGMKVAFGHLCVYFGGTSGTDLEIFFPNLRFSAQMILFTFLSLLISFLYLNFRRKEMEIDLLLLSKNERETKHL